MKYVFAKNINKGNVSGIIDIESNEIVCLCSKVKSKLLLQALNLADVSVQSHPKCNCDRCTGLDTERYYEEDMKGD